MFPRHNAQVLSAEELAQKAMDYAANAMAAGRKTLSREETLGQEASSALLQGGTISDKVYCGRSVAEFLSSSGAEIRPHQDSTYKSITVLKLLQVCGAARKKTCLQVMPRVVSKLFASLFSNVGSASLFISRMNATVRINELRYTLLFLWRRSKRSRKKIWLRGQRQTNQVMAKKSCHQMMAEQSTWAG